MGTLALNQTEEYSSAKFSVSNGADATSETIFSLKGRLP